MSVVLLAITISLYLSLGSPNVKHPENRLQRCALLRQLKVKSLIDQTNFNMCITNLKYEGGDQWNVQYDFEVTDFFRTENTVRKHAGRKFYIWG